MTNQDFGQKHPRDYLGRFTYKDLASIPNLLWDAYRHRGIIYGREESITAYSYDQFTKLVKESRIKGHSNQDEMKRLLDTKLKSNQLSLFLNPEKDSRHRKDSLTYRKGSSFLIISYEKTQQLIEKFYGTGIFNYAKKTGIFNSRETVDFLEIIGYYVDEDTNNIYPTTRGTIHYSKTGVHLVPSKPDELL